MNRNQGIALAIGVANLLLITLFPPVDQYSIAASNIPVFAGFHFITQRPPLGIVNADLLTIEIIVVLVNLPIAWLLLGDRSRSASLQNASLLFTGACNRRHAALSREHIYRGQRCAALADCQGRGTSGGRSASEVGSTLARSGAINRHAPASALQSHRRSLNSTVAGATGFEPVRVAREIPSGRRGCAGW